MANAGARAHALRETRIQLAVIALGVVVIEAAREHPGDDLHVLMRVGTETGAGLDAVVVRHEQQPVVRVGRVVMLAEAEAVPAVEPVEFGVVARVGAANVDHAHLLLLRFSVSCTAASGVLIRKVRLSSRYSSTSVASYDRYPIERS